MTQSDAAALSEGVYLLRWADGRPSEVARIYRDSLGVSWYVLRFQAAASKDWSPVQGVSKFKPPPPA